MSRQNLWGGRFSAATDSLFQQFNDSLGFDRELLREDLEGSIAWAGALVEAGVLTADQGDRIETALEEIGAGRRNHERRRSRGRPQPGGGVAA